MKIDGQRYLASGEFAKTVGCSKHTLFHYDEIDLFKPEIVLENGYRYYSMSQIDQFQVIEILKELKLPLNEIKEYLKERSPIALLNLLKHEENLIDQKIKELRYMKHWIVNKSLLVENTLNKDLSLIEIVSLPKQWVYSAALKDYDNKTISKGIGELVRNSRKHQIVSMNGVGVSLSLKQIAKSGYGCYDEIYMISEKEKKQLTKIKPAGDYLCAYHVGSYATTYQGFERLIQYAREHDYQLDDRIYEDVLIDEMAVGEEENFVFRISVRIIR